MTLALGILDHPGQIEKMRRTFQVDGYELVCTAVPRDNGHFEPALVITRLTWPTRARTIAVHRDPQPTEGLAIAVAYKQGVEWIRNFG